MKNDKYGTWRFWLWGFLFIFLVHAFAIFRFSDRRDPAPALPPAEAFLYSGLDEKGQQRVSEAVLFSDPTLFALPHAESFSGGAWIHFHPDLPKLSNWSATPEWLALPSEQLGNSLLDYVATNHLAEEQLLASMRAPENLEIRLPDSPLIAETTVRVEGPLAARKLIGVPSLPSATNADVLHRTVVAVSVNGDGVVETAALIGDSGSKAADDQAVDLARLFAFDSVSIRDAHGRENSTPMLGRLIFTWHVTNASATTASAP